MLLEGEGVIKIYFALGTKNILSRLASGMHIYKYIRTSLIRTPMNVKNCSPFRRNINLKVLIGTFLFKCLFVLSKFY